MKIRQAGFAHRQRAGLVKGHHLDVLQGLQRFTLAEQDAQFGAASGSDHDRCRRRQPHGTGAGDNQNRHGVDKAKGQGRLRAKNQPDDKGQRGQCHNRGHEPHGHAVHQRLDRQLSPLGGLDHADDLGQHRRFAHRRGAKGEGTGLVDRATGHGAANRLFHRQRLARDHAFVDPTGPFGHFTVDRHPFTGAHRDQIGRANLGNRHLDNSPVCKDSRRFGLQADQTLDRLRGSPLGPRLQHAAKQDQRHDDGCRLVIDVHRARWQQIGKEGCDQRIAIGG